MSSLYGQVVDIGDGGALTEEWKEGAPEYNFRALLEYCKKVGKRPKDLPDEERERFRTN